MAPSKPRSPNPSRPTRSSRIIESHRLALRCRIRERLDADAAHDWKGCLNRAVLDLELARVDVEGTSPEDADARIRSAIDQLRALATSFQTLSQRAPRSLVAGQRVDLGDTFAAVERMMAPSLSRSPITLSFATDEVGLAVPGDAESIELLIASLVQNAIDALDVRGDGGAVQVRAARGGTDAVITVVDTGPGVDPSVLAQLRDATPSCVPSGVGLPFAHRLCGRLSGRLDVENRGEGGVRATIVLPLASDSARAEGAS